MKIVGTHIVLRDEKRDSDDDLFRWINLEEWNYYGEPDAPFRAVTREAFDEWRRRPRQPSPNSHRWHVDTADGKHIGWVNYYQLDARTPHHAPFSVRLEV